MFLCDAAKHEMSLAQQIGALAHDDMRYWREIYLDEKSKPYDRIEALKFMLQSQEEYEAFAYPVIKTLMGERS